MTIQFYDLTLIYKRMSLEKSDRAKLFIDSAELKETLESIRDFDSAKYDSGIDIIGDSENIEIGSTIKIKVESPKPSLGYLAENFSDYLKRPKTKIREVPFFLIDCKTCSADQDIPNEVKNYKIILRLVRTIATCSHYFDKDQESLTFYKDGKFDVKIDYSVKDLENTDALSLEKIETLLLDKNHQEQKNLLLANTITEKLKDTPEKLRFSLIISELSDIYARFQTAYNLFSKDFSYEKARDEINKFKLDIIGRIHKAISDIQTQLLGIPLASFIALSQIKSTQSFDTQLAANTLILIGVLIFCLLLHGLTRNQTLTLNTIKGETDRQLAVLKEKFNLTPDAYTQPFIEIEERLSFQFKAIKLIIALNIIAALFSIIYYASHINLTSSNKKNGETSIALAHIGNHGQINALRKLN